MEMKKIPFQSGIVYLKIKQKPKSQRYMYIDYSDNFEKCCQSIKKRKKKRKECWYLNTTLPSNYRKRLRIKKTNDLQLHVKSPHYTI